MRRLSTYALVATTARADWLFIVRVPGRVLSLIAQVVSRRCLTDEPRKVDATDVERCAPVGGGDVNVTVGSPSRARAAWTSSSGVFVRHVASTAPSWRATAPRNRGSSRWMTTGRPMRAFSRT